MAKIVKIRDKKLIWRENSSIFLIFILTDTGEKIWAIYWHHCSGAALCYTFFMENRFYAMLREDIPVNKAWSWKLVPKIGVQPSLLFLKLCLAF